MEQMQIADPQTEQDRSHMRAAIVTETGNADAFALREVPLPEPGPDEVLIAVAACGVCFHDILARSGAFGARMQMPFIPGHEVAGTVVAIGGAVRQFKPGDRVAATNRRHICGHCDHCRTGREGACAEKRNLGDGGLNGGYAEYVCTGEDNVALVPAGVPLEHAAIAACAMGTQLNAVRAAGVRPGERVLVLGASGGLGAHGIQFARIAGAEVFALTGSEAKAEAIRALGAHHVVVAPHGADFSAGLRRMTGGRGVDVVVDNVGSPTFAATRKSLANFARWVFVGQVNGESVPFNPAHLFFRGATILTAKNATRAQLVEILDMLERGMVRPVIHGRYGLDGAAAAHRAVEGGQALGRVVIRPDAQG